MNVEVVVPNDYSSAILSDLSQRRSIIEDISARENVKVEIFLHKILDNTCEILILISLVSLYCQLGEAARKAI